MKDVTASVFGLLIAFVLPGFVALSGVLFFISPPGAVATYGKDLNSSSAPLVFLFLTCLVLSQILGAGRFYLFEKWLYKSEGFGPNLYRKLGTSDGLLAFRQAIDEHYRYYQFHGGMVLSLPFLTAGALFAQRGKLTFWSILLTVLAFAALEVLEFKAAKDQLQATFSRGRWILGASDLVDGSIEKGRNEKQL